MEDLSPSIRENEGVSLSSQIDIWASLIGPVSRKCRIVHRVFLPYGYFYLNIRDRRTSSSLPLNVTVDEQPFPTVTSGSITLGGGKALILDEKTKVYNGKGWMLPGYNISEVKSFQMKLPYIRVIVRTKRTAKEVENFKASRMVVTVTYGENLSETTHITISYGNPNNHYHWRNENEYVDGWFFKCVHVDSSTRKATPFFFLYGVNRNKGHTAEEKSFVYFGHGGEVSLRTDLLAPVAGTTPTPPEVVEIERPFADFWGEKYIRLDSQIGSDFRATDIGCKGTVNAGTSNEILWDLDFTKFHNQVVSDYNPLPGGYGTVSHAGHHLWSYVDRPIGISALYMAHSMNCLVSGTLKWKGKTYQFDKLKGHQDENWGASGFPHPYVWAQANNFRFGSGSLPRTWLVAFYTPCMPVPGPDALVGAIFIRHNGNNYRFFKGKYCPGLNLLADIFMDLGSMSCKVDLVQGTTTKTVDMSDDDDVNNKLGPFNVRKNDSSKWVYPVKFTFEAENDAGCMPWSGDRIKVVFECPKSGVYRLRAPMNGKMEPGATKQSTHARVKVELTPLGQQTETMESDFATVDFGD